MNMIILFPQQVPSSNGDECLKCMMFDGPESQDHPIMTPASRSLAYLAIFSLLGRHEKNLRLCYSSHCQLSL